MSKNRKHHLDFNPISKKFIGIDFSGAKKCYHKIWITTGRFNYKLQTREILVNNIFNLLELAKTINNRDKAYKVLVNYLLKQENSIIGFDFPLCLPEKLLSKKKYIIFINNFPIKHKSEKDFKRYCKRISEEKEIKRKCEIEVKTPFSSYNLRLYKQTYFGIKKILLPLINNGFSVLPYMLPGENNNWIIEVCPASTLKKLNLYRNYKSYNKKNIELTLEKLISIFNVKFKNIQDIDRIILNKKLDAFDSFVAFLAVARSSLKPHNYIFPEDNIYNIEGYIYT